MDYKDVLGLLATLIAFVSYIPYFRDIAANRTKPHAFSWFVWFVLTLISFFAQISDNAGSGAWVTGFTALVCFIIFLFGLKKGKKNIAFLDWVCLSGAIMAIILWFITKTPLFSVMLIITSDALGFLPTFRKSYLKPYEETISTFALSGFKYVIAFFSLRHISIITALYPTYLIFMNFVFVSMLIIRRYQLGPRLLKATYSKKS